jgi:hypothetical protein
MPLDAVGSCSRCKYDGWSIQKAKTKLFDAAVSPSEAISTVSLQDAYHA